MMRLTTCAACDASPEPNWIWITFELRIGVTLRRLAMRTARSLMRSLLSAALAMFIMLPPARARARPRTTCSRSWRLRMTYTSELTIASFSFSSARLSASVG